MLKRLFALVCFLSATEPCWAKRVHKVGKQRTKAVEVQPDNFAGMDASTWQLQVGNWVMQVHKAGKPAWQEVSRTGSGIILKKFGKTNLWQLLSADGQWKLSVGTDGMAEFIQVIEVADLDKFWLDGEPEGFSLRTKRGFFQPVKSEQGEVLGLKFVWQQPAEKLFSLQPYKPLTEPEQGSVELEGGVTDEVSELAADAEENFEALGDEFELVDGLDEDEWAAELQAVSLENTERVLNPAGLPLSDFLQEYEDEPFELRWAVQEVAEFITGHAVEFVGENSLELKNSAYLNQRKDMTGRVLQFLQNGLKKALSGSLYARAEDDPEDPLYNAVLDLYDLVDPVQKDDTPVVQTMRQLIKKWSLYDKLDLAEDMTYGMYEDPFTGELVKGRDLWRAKQIVNSISEQELAGSDDPFGYAEWLETVEYILQSLERRLAKF